MAVPDRPDPDDIVASTWGQWVHDDTLRTVALRWRKHTGPTDSNGYMAISAAVLGLTTIIGGTASSAAQGTATVHNVVTECLADAGGGTLIVRLMGIDVTTNDATTYASLASTVVNVIAWGTLVA